MTANAQTRLGSPEQALRSPLWLGALLVLGLNDHWLKGAGLLSGLLTGKLSDFAGLLVAPALLAVVIRAHSRSAWLGCHVAVGVVFSALQLDANAAEFWGRGLSTLGISWVTVSDPWDLIALPMLALSARTLRQPRAAVDGHNRALTLAIAGVGLLLCTGTSRRDEPGADLPGGFFQVPSIGPRLSNPTDQTLTVQLRGLRDSVVLDCEAVAQNPGGLIPTSAFEPVVRYALPPGGQLSTDAHLHGGACSAVLISGEGLTPGLLFFTLTRTQAEGGAAGSFSAGAPLVEIAHADGAHTGFTSELAGLVHRWPGRRPEVGEACELQPDKDRLDWSLGSISAGSYQLSAVTEGVDGCMELTLHPMGLAMSGEQDAGVETETLPEDEAEDEGQAGFVCMPQELFPFETGDRVQVSSVDDGLLRMSAQDREGITLELVRGAQPTRSPLVEARVGEADCGFTVREACAEVVRPAQMRIDHADGTRLLETGELTEVEDHAGRRYRVLPTIVQVRALVDTACAPDGSLTDLEYIVLSEEEVL